MKTLKLSLKKYLYDFFFKTAKWADFIEPAVLTPSLYIGTNNLALTSQAAALFYLLSVLAAPSGLAWRLELAKENIKRPKPKIDVKSTLTGWIGLGATTYPHIEKIPYMDSEHLFAASVVGYGVYKGYYNLARLITPSLPKTLYRSLRILTVNKRAKNTFILSNPDKIIHSIFFIPAKDRVKSLVTYYLSPKKDHIVLPRSMQKKTVYCTQIDNLYPEKIFSHDDVLNYFRKKYFQINPRNISEAVLLTLYSHRHGYSDEKKRWQQLFEKTSTFTKTVYPNIVKQSTSYDEYENNFILYKKSGLSKEEILDFQKLVTKTKDNPEFFAPVTSPESDGGDIVSVFYDHPTLHEWYEGKTWSQQQPVLEKNLEHIVWLSETLLTEPFSHRETLDLHEKYLNSAFDRWYESTLYQNIQTVLKEPLTALSDPHGDNFLYNHYIGSQIIIDVENKGKSAQIFNFVNAIEYSSSVLDIAEFSQIEHLAKQFYHSHGVGSFDPEIYLAAKQLRDHSFVNAWSDPSHGKPQDIASYLEQSKRRYSQIINAYPALVTQGENAMKTAAYLQERL